MIATKMFGRAATSSGDHADVGIGGDGYGNMVVKLFTSPSGTEFDIAGALGLAALLVAAAEELRKQEKP